MPRSVVLAAGLVVQLELVAAAQPVVREAVCFETLVVNFR